MNTNFKDLKIVPLSEDIRQILNEVGQDKVEIMRLCKDHTNPYLLEDKKPVFHDIGQDQLLCIFDFGVNHFFLLPEQLFRFAIFCKLGFYRSIVLMLKSEWELFLSKSIGQVSKITSRNNSRFLDKRLIEKHVSDFNPDKGRIYNLIRELPDAKDLNKSRSNINLVIEDMVKELYFIYENHLINDFYPEKEGNESHLLNKASELQVKEYKKLKYLWRRRTTELEEKLLEGEKKKRINQNMEDLYYRTFGRLELEKLALTYNVEKFKKVLELKKSNPGLTYRQAVKKAIKHLTSIANKAKELKNIYWRSLNCISGLTVGGGIEISKLEVTKYHEEIKEVLKKLFFLLHSDTCPVKDLTETQKSGINELWLELMSSKDELYSYTPGMLMWSLPNIDKLLSILRRACKILDIKMEDLDVADRLELMIRKGTPIEKIIEFLEQDVEVLQLHLTNLEIIQDEYTNEKKTLFYRNALENIENHKVKSKNEILTLKKQVTDLKDQIKEVFKQMLIKSRTT